ncbi:MAG: superoxide dismutase [Gammaproteobacteria bacterium RIFCSPHIGHO2_12_FULL_41_20]|nr:MAG: superoxide dismutase [Gammaproteobacteria bacterium RIFCSPHIGHO2_12_FULL_41_20]
MLKLNRIFIALTSCFISTLSIASITVPIYTTTKQGLGKAVGIVIISKNSYGLLFTPQLQGLSPGIHGFHIHENPSCAQEGMAAGGHLDPHHTGKHLGPYNNHGHLGDLPALYVDTAGTATLPVLAPRLRMHEVMHHALMIHEGGDNYSDTPVKLGGGGSRMECGVINEHS